MDRGELLIHWTETFTELSLDADSATAVPTCPGWDLTRLLRHVGRGQRWAAQIIRHRAQTMLDPHDVLDGKAPNDTAAARAWLRSGAQLVLDAVAQTGPEVMVWTFLGARPARWWVRRMLHEVVVHSVDAAVATHGSYFLPDDLAQDGLDEWLERLEVELIGVAPPALSRGAVIELEQTDGPERWQIRGLADGMWWQRQPETETDGSVTVTLSGPAAELFLAAVRRVRTQDTQIVVQGDLRAWETWLSRTPL